MNLDRLALYYHDPSEMANHPLAELEELVREYPFFTAGQLLLLKQYRIQNSSRYKKQHRKMLALAPDPVRAFLFTEGDAWIMADEAQPLHPQSVVGVDTDAQDVSINEVPVSASEDTDLAFVLPSVRVDDNSPNANQISTSESGETLDVTSPDPDSVSHPDFVHQRHELHDWFRFYAQAGHLSGPAANSVSEQEEAKTSRDDQTAHHQVDTDYERELLLAASVDLLSAPSVPLMASGMDALRVKVGDEQADPLSADSMHSIRLLAQASIDDEQLPASETLAEVFARQQEWDYAIALYEQLILMNPEKLPIFAARIAEFKKAKG